MLPSRPKDLKRWDVFLSHASEDKEFARSLAEKLTLLGIRVWYDEHVLKIGDSLHDTISTGLSDSRFAIVILSPDFLKKRWTNNELSAVIAIESADTFRILPIWHNLDSSQIAERYPILLDRFALSSIEGIDRLAYAIVQKVHLSITAGKEEFSSFTGLWTGLSGRMILSETDDRIFGEYDWYGSEMIGSLVGTLKRWDLMIFEWQEGVFNRHGTGFFALQMPIKSKQPYLFLSGAWADSDHPVDFNEWFPSVAQPKDDSSAHPNHHTFINKEPHVFTHLPSRAHRWEYARQMAS